MNEQDERALKRLESLDYDEYPDTAAVEEMAHIRARLAHLDKLEKALAGMYERRLRHFVGDVFERALHASNGTGSSIAAALIAEHAASLPSTETVQQPQGGQRRKRLQSE